MKSKESIALFAGTFDPYTIGHHRIVQRALATTDKVVVAIGHNIDKRTMFTIEERLDTIKKLYANEPRVEVTSYQGLTIDYAQSIGATHLLRSIRSVKDFEYERDLADLNLRIGKIDTLLLISEPEYAAISSSVVRELLSYGKDVSKLLP